MRQKKSFFLPTRGLKQGSSLLESVCQEGGEGFEFFAQGKERFWLFFEPIVCLLLHKKTLKEMPKRTIILIISYKKLPTMLFGIRSFVWGRAEMIRTLWNYRCFLPLLLRTQWS